MDLTAQQDENASRDGKDRQNNTKTTNAKKRYHAPGDKKDGQQDHAYAFGKGKFQSCTPFQGK
jgi:hypothetical protein